jgi:hypothetical protein
MHPVVNKHSEDATDGAKKLFTGFPVSDTVETVVEGYSTLGKFEADD